MDALSLGSQQTCLSLMNSMKSEMLKFSPQPLLRFVDRNGNEF